VLENGRLKKRKNRAAQQNKGCKRSEMELNNWPHRKI